MNGPLILDHSINTSYCYYTLIAQLTFNTYRPVTTTKLLPKWGKKTWRITPCCFVLCRAKFSCVETSCWGPRIPCRKWHKCNFVVLDELRPREVSNCELLPGTFGIFHTCVFRRENRKILKFYWTIDDDAGICFAGILLEELNDFSIWWQLRSNLITNTTICHVIIFLEMRFFCELRGMQKKTRLYDQWRLYWNLGCIASYL